MPDTMAIKDFSGTTEQQEKNHYHLTKKAKGVTCQPWNSWNSMSKTQKEDRISSGIPQEGAYNFLANSILIL